MSEPREDALTIGQQLRKREGEAREQRIREALNSDRRWNVMCLAETLYDATYKGVVTEPKEPAERVLDDLCQVVFGASYEEVLEAWDRYLA